MPATSALRQAVPAPSLSVSLVLYRNPPAMVSAVLASLRNTPCEMHICVIDNSPTAELRVDVCRFGANYIHEPRNPGFGASHNRARRALPDADFHLVINPDIYFEREHLIAMLQFMCNNTDVGLLSPRVLHPDGKTQHLCKRYPSVFLLFARRFLPSALRSLTTRRMDEYEMRDTGYRTTFDVPYATGCFMLFRREVYDTIGGFDERFWLYLEDADISIRTNRTGKRVLFFPDAHVFHHWARGSHASLRLTLASIRSSIRFFRKHGWKWI